MGYEIPVGFGLATLRLMNADNHECLISFGYAVTVGVGADEVADNLHTETAADIEGFLNSFSTYRGWHTVQNTGGPFGEGDFATNTSGTFSADVAAPQCQYIFKKLTGLAGRAHRGRFYWPTVSQESISGGGDLNSTEFTRISAFSGSLYADLMAAFGETVPYLLHSEGSSLPPDPISQFLAEQAIATQRRRFERS